MNRSPSSASAAVFPAARIRRRPFGKCSARARTPSAKSRRTAGTSPHTTIPCRAAPGNPFPNGVVSSGTLTGLIPDFLEFPRAKPIALTPNSAFCSKPVGRHLKTADRLWKKSAARARAFSPAFQLRIMPCCKTPAAGATKRMFIPPPARPSASLPTAFPTALICAGRAWRWTPPVPPR